MPNHATTPARPDRTDRWQVAKTMKPTQRGAIKLARLHGAALLCVRYRESLDGTERLTTIELVVDRVIIEKRADPIVAFKIKANEPELRRLAQSKGATFDGRTKLWKLQRREVLRMGLRSRIAVPIDQILQEQMQP